MPVVLTVLTALVACTPVQTPAGAEPAPAATRAQPPSGRWIPDPGMTWQWQLSGTVDTGVDAATFDVDSVGTSAQTVAELHAKGRKVICYVNAGAAENFRPDYGRFPPEVKGKPNGWPGEQWLDVRRR